MEHKSFSNLQEKRNSPWLFKRQLLLIKSSSDFQFLLKNSFNVQDPNFLIKLPEGLENSFKFIFWLLPTPTMRGALFVQILP